MSVSPRTCIRKYVVELLKSKDPSGSYYVEVEGKVFAERESPIFKQETPCVMVYFENETHEIFGGDKYRTIEYMNDLRLFIDVVVDSGINPGQPVLENYDVEDKLDHIAFQIEMLLYDDNYLGKLLKDYNELNGDGLLEGMHKVLTSPYLVNTGGERKLSSQRMEWSLFYRTDAFIEKKLNDFLEFNAKFLKVGTDTDNVEPEDILIEADITITESTFISFGIEVISFGKAVVL